MRDSSDWVIELERLSSSWVTSKLRRKPPKDKAATSSSTLALMRARASRLSRARSKESRERVMAERSGIRATPSGHARPYSPPRAAQPGAPHRHETRDPGDRRPRRSRAGLADPAHREFWARATPRTRSAHTTR